jgi:cytochrome c oxidase accessory protein FixG
MSEPAAASVQEVKLYARHVKLYPKATRGWFTSWRWAMVWFTQLLYYGTVWLEWNGRQAVLFHLAERKFYIFGLVLWPQDFIYLTGLLIISAYALFLFTAVAGRLFCGYACPQTVYTEIFMWIEKLIEGDRVRRMKLDQAANSPKKLALKTLKLGLWSAIALWTGFTFVAYFTPIRELSAEVLSLTVSGWSLFWMLFYAGFTLLQAGFMREQVCKYMCPYARFQSSMFDKDTMIVTYDTERGEPRGARAKKSDAKAQGVGDCVDCGICVHVCPTGIDIRQGLQYECIGCGACIDGCDTMMDKMGYARGLIRYSTEHAMQQHWSKKEIWAHVFRVRTLVYATILLLITCLWAGALYWRNPLKVDVIRDRGSLARELDAGVIENVYRLQMINTEELTREVVIRVEGLEGAVVASRADVTLAPTSSVFVPVRVQVPPGVGQPGSNRLRFIVEQPQSHHQVVEKAAFFIPR